VATTIITEVETCDTGTTAVAAHRQTKVLAREAETNLPSLTAIHSRDELDKRVRDIIDAKD
jgi:hypothetical protein